MLSKMLALLFLVFITQAATEKYKDTSKIEYFSNKGCVGDIDKTKSDPLTGVLKEKTVADAKTHGLECVNGNQIKLLKDTLKATLSLDEDVTVDNGACKDFKVGANEVSIKLSWDGACTKAPEDKTKKNVLTEVDVLYYTDGACKDESPGKEKNIHEQNATLDKKTATNYIFKCIEKDFTLSITNEDKAKSIDVPLKNNECHKFDDTKSVKAIWKGACMPPTYEDVKIEYFKAKDCKTGEEDKANAPFEAVALEGLTVEVAKKEGMECVDNKQIKLSKSKFASLKDDVTVDNATCKNTKDSSDKDVSIKLSWKGACMPEKSGLSTGAIVAIVFACVAVLGIIGGAFAYYKSS